MTNGRPSGEPLVSIVITAYNHGHLIAETLASIEAQTYATLEIVVVDDGSTDDTATVTERAFAKSRHKTKLIRQANTGMAVARARGFEASTGELVCFFDSDDLMFPEKTADQVRALQEHPEVDAVIDNFTWLDPGGQQSPYDGAPQFTDRWDLERFEEYLVCSRGPGVPAGLFKRSIIEAIGGPDQGLPMNDWPFLLAYARASRRLRVTRTPVFAYRLHAQQSHSSKPLQLLDWKLQTARRFCSPRLVHKCAARAHRIVADQFLATGHPVQALWHLAVARRHGPQAGTRQFVADALRGGRRA